MATDILYGDDDPDYVNTLLVSPIPPPRLTPPRSRNGSDSRERERREPPPVYRTDIAIPHQQPLQWLACDLNIEQDGWLDGLKVIVDKASVREIDYNQFCDKDIVDALHATKMTIDNLTPPALHLARSRANPYERIGKSIFVNRSAVKMANLDASCDFTNVMERTGSSELKFADICAGPGGFTEYLLWRANSCQIKTRGWGMTLKGEQDFSLDNMHPGSRAQELFEPFYGIDGTGDIYQSDNIRAFTVLIDKATNGEGVDLVTGDGGFNISGDELHQEDHSKQLILCQILTMFLILRKGGDFTVKVFDMFTPFTVELFYILYRYFEKVAVVKPFTSRPANAERYIVCHSLRTSRPSRIIAHLFTINDSINESKGTRPSSEKVVSSHNVPQPGFEPWERKIAAGTEEVIGLMDIETVLADEKFLNRVRSTNMKLSIRQTEGLEELYKYACDPNFPAFDQIDIRNRCLQEWNLPISERDSSGPRQNQQRRHQDGREERRFSPYGNRERNREREGYNRHQREYHNRERDRDNGAYGERYR